VSITQT